VQTAGWEAKADLEMLETGVIVMELTAAPSFFALLQVPRDDDDELRKETKVTTSKLDKERKRGASIR
jgi:hypothetical protein